MTRQIYVDNSGAPYVIGSSAGVTDGKTDPEFIMQAIPDYANMETTNRITANNGTWTADRTGFVRLLFVTGTLSGSTWHAYQGTIEGKEVFWGAAAPATTGVNWPYGTVVPVMAGQTVKLNWSGTTSLNQLGCYFIPPKFVTAQAPTIVQYQPAFEGETDANGYMFFYLDPAGDDSADGLTPATARQSLPNLLDWIKNNPTLPRDYGVQILLAAGEYTLPTNYEAPFLHRPLQIIGLTPTNDYALTVILNVSGNAYSGMTFFSQTNLAFLTIKGAITSGDVSTALVTLGGGTTVISNVYFENTSADKTFSAIRIRGVKGQMARCGFKGFGYCVHLANAILSYDHASDYVGEISGNNVFISNNEGFANVFGYNSIIAASPVNPSGGDQGLTTFRGNDYVTSELPTGQVWIDGKPIYRRVFTGTITGTGNTVVSTVLLAGVGNLVSFNGWWNATMTTTKHAVPCHFPTEVAGGLITANVYVTVAKDLVLQTYTATARTGSTLNAYQVWVEYTKL